MTESSSTDASPQGHFALESLILLASVLRIECVTRRTLHILSTLMAEIEVRLIAELYSCPFVLRPITVAFSECDPCTNILMLGSLNVAAQIDLVEATTDG